MNESNSERWKLFGKLLDQFDEHLYCRRVSFDKNKYIGRILLQKVNIKKSRSALIILKAIYKNDMIGPFYDTFEDIILREEINQKLKHKIDMKKLKMEVAIEKL